MRCVDELEDWFVAGRELWQCQCRSQLGDRSWMNLSVSRELLQSKFSNEISAVCMVCVACTVFTLRSSMTVVAWIRVKVVNTIWNGFSANGFWIRCSAGFWILKAGFWILIPSIPDSIGRNFQDSRIRITLHGARKSSTLYFLKYFERVVLLISKFTIFEWYHKRSGKCIYEVIDSNWENGDWTHSFKLKIFILASKSEKLIKISACLCDVGVKFEQVATRNIIIWKELIYGRKFSWKLPWEVINQKRWLRGLFT